MTIQEIGKLVDEYNRLSKGLIDYKKYAYYAATHHSTSIEGSTLTESQVINLLEFGKPAANKPFEHHQMVYDHFQAMLLLADLAQKRKPFSTMFIQQVAAKVMYSTGSFVNTAVGNFSIADGEFRLCSVRAGTRTFPDYKKVPKLIQDLCNETNLGLKTAKTFQQKCELAFKVHFDLVSIHPFGDGNGRTSRVLMNYVQMYFGLPLSVVLKQDRIPYINALEAARQREDIRVFYDFMFLQYAKFLKREIKALSA